MIKVVAVSFIREVVRLHGFPSSIIFDRDRVFMSIFWKEVFKMAGSKLKFTSTYHPQSKAEVINRTLETYLRCFLGGHPKSWIEWLSWAEFWFNSSHNVYIGMSPFRAMYGREA